MPDFTQKHMKTVHTWSREDILALVRKDAAERGIEIYQLDELQFVIDYRSVEGVRLYSVRENLV